MDNNKKVNDDSLKTNVEENSVFGPLLDNENTTSQDKVEDLPDLHLDIENVEIPKNDFELSSLNLISNKFEEHKEYKPISLEPKQSKKKSLKWLIIMLIIILLGGGVTFWILKNQKEETPVEAPETENPPQVIEEPSKAVYCSTTEETDTYEMGQYKYELINNDHWHVEVKDKELRDPIVSKLCTYINDIPVTDMSKMFYNSEAQSVDNSSWDTSNVTNMSYMFADSSLGGFDLSNLDTSKVTDMSYMFLNMHFYDLDFSNFDTSNVTTMERMFSNTNVNKLDLSSFDTSKVVNMSYMFWNTKAKELDLSNFDVSNVKYFNYMFYANESDIFLKREETAEKLKSRINYTFTGNFVVSN